MPVEDMLEVIVEDSLECIARHLRQMRLPEYMPTRDTSHMLTTLVNVYTVMSNDLDKKRDKNGERGLLPDLSIDPLGLVSGDA